MADLWYPDAVQDPGPTWKQGYTDCYTRTGKGIVCHSMEGRLQSALARLDSNDLASWHFSVPVVGGVMQHYPLARVAWHAGGVANRLYTGAEFEGRAGEPLSEAQIVSGVKLIAWQAEVEEWPVYARQATLWEHNEFAATACPSGRIPWDEFIKRLTEKPVDPAELYLLVIEWMYDWLDLARGPIGMDRVAAFYRKWDKKLAPPA